MQGKPLPLHCGNLSEYSLEPGISMTEKHTHIQISHKNPVRTKALADYELLAEGEWHKWWYGVPYHILKQAYDGSRKRKQDVKAQYASLAWDVKELPQKNDFDFVERYYDILSELQQGEEKYVDPYNFLSHLPVTPMPDVKPPRGYKLLQEAPPFVRGVGKELWKQNQKNKVGTLFVEIENDPESEDEEPQGERKEKGSSTAAKEKGGAGKGKGAATKQAPVAKVDEDVVMRSGEEDEDEEDEEDEDEEDDANEDEEEDDDEDEEKGDEDEDVEGNRAGDGDNVGKKGDDTEHSEDSDAPYAWYSNSDSETKDVPSGRGTKRDRSPGALDQFSTWGGIDEHFTDSSEKTIQRLMSVTRSPPRKVKRGKIYVEAQTKIGKWPASPSADIT